MVRLRVVASTAQAARGAWASPGRSMIPAASGGDWGTTMIMRRIAGWVSGASAMAAALLTVMPVQAHHSFAMFDHDHQVKLTGTVKHFQWTNPHVYIELAAMDPSGAA